MNGARSFEGVIIAAVAGALSVSGSYLSTVPKVTAQLENLSRNVAELREENKASKSEANKDRGDLIRLQTQLAELQRQSQERLAILERRVFNIPR